MGSQNFKSYKGGDAEPQWLPKRNSWIVGTAMGFPMMGAGTLFRKGEKGFQDLTRKEGEKCQYLF